MVVSEQVLMGLVVVLLGHLVQAQDCEKPKRDTMTLIDADILKETFPDGSSVTFKCSTGYTNSGGSGQTFCNAGTWTTVTLKCQKYNCGGLEVDNGHVEYDGGPLFGNTATFSCNDGYILGRPTQLTCGAEGWIGRPPTCTVVKCSTAPSVENAEAPSPDLQLYNYASVVKYTCLKDYTINGTSSLRCSNDGTFKPNPPTCITVRCKAPIIPDGSQKSGARPPYVFKSSVVYECNTGFVMTGSTGYMTCQLNSTWSSTPVCKAIIITTTPTTTTTTMTPKTPTTTTTTMTPKTPATTATTKKDVITGGGSEGAGPGVDPEGPTGGSDTWSQSWWFIVLMIVFVIFIIFLVLFVIRKKRGPQPVHDAVAIEEDKIL